MYVDDTPEMEQALFDYSCSIDSDAGKRCRRKAGLQFAIEPSTTSDSE